MAVIFVGPWCAGKSTWGRAYAQLVGSEFVDLDELAPHYGKEVGWSVEQLLGRNEAVGMLRSEAEWEPVRTHIVERALEDYPQAVIAFGASYTGYTDSRLEARVEKLLDRHSVVLATPAMDNAEAAAICWSRAVQSRGAAWAQERSLFSSWWPTELDWRLADAVLTTEPRLALH